MISNWSEIIRQEKQKEYFQQLISFIQKDSKTHKIFPKHYDVFNAFKFCPIDKVKCVILGMDPYHGEGQAHGLSFSVMPSVPVPPSLRNIFKELKSDLNFDIPNHGYLENWARQGVLLLNSCLTVREGQAGSHSKRGWEIFSDTIISIINNIDRPIAYMLWGNIAKNKASLLTNKQHLVLTANHPSPLSSHTNWFGTKHFSKTNQFLTNHNQQPINWQLSNF